jgi:hypothetical protein
MVLRVRYRQTLEPLSIVLTMNIRVELDHIAQSLVGTSVNRPSGTLAGHAAGLPFERSVHEKLVAKFPGRAFRHYELLNFLYSNNPTKESLEERYELLGPESLSYLLRRGASATAAWTTTAQFTEKQDDTAESVVLPSASLSLDNAKNGPPTLIDVKTQDADVKSRAPNIISAEKLLNACKIAISEGSQLSFDIVYIGVRWKKTRATLDCVDAEAVPLVRVDPTEMYINWSAGRQIQFHPQDVKTDFSGSTLEWAVAFLDHYSSNLRTRLNKELKKLNELESYTRALKSEAQDQK